MNREEGVISRKVVIKLALISIAIVGSIFAIVHLAKAPKASNTGSLFPSFSDSTPIFNNTTNTPASPAGQAPSAEDFLNSIPKDEPKKAMPNAAPYEIPLRSGEAVGAPVIDHLSTTVFGNGDTITIYGKNFTKSNTVDLSIDFPDSFTDIQSITGTSLRFTAKLALSESMAEQFDQLSPKEHDMVVKHVIESMSAGTGHTDGLYLSATLKVKTSFGESNAVPVQVNVTKGL